MSTKLESHRDMNLSAPFYALPTRKTSAQIIKEARNDMSIKGLTSGVGGMTAAMAQRNNVRTVHTKRPFTPRDKERTLFGTSAAVRGERPPSSFT